MAHARMPRGNATAWVSKPRHRSPPIRPGENNPGPDHGFKILRPGNLSRARHTSPPGKRGEADLKNDLQPVAATTRHRLHLPSRKPTNQEVQISARPNRNSRSGRHPHAQIQPSEKIKKTTWFDLILLTPKTHLSGCQKSRGSRVQIRVGEILMEWRRSELGPHHPCCRLLHRPHP